LEDILTLELGILACDFVGGIAITEELQDELDREPKAPDRGPALANTRNYADAVEHGWTLRRPGHAGNSGIRTESCGVSEGT
jgi:hypothetical protein